MLAGKLFLILETLRLKFAVATRIKPNLLNHLTRNSLAKSVHVIGRADVHKSSNL